MDAPPQRHQPTVPSTKAAEIPPLSAHRSSPCLSHIITDPVTIAARVVLDAGLISKVIYLDYVGLYYSAKLRKIAWHFTVEEW